MRSSALRDVKVVSVRQADREPSKVGRQQPSGALLKGYGPAQMGPADAYIIWSQRAGRVVRHSSRLESFHASCKSQGMGIVQVAYN